ncbi:MAG: hypothetical protein KKC25_00915, partial [Proteobacteria bacterium]|nr:hypothetical protein [Pseudomonadota bacterium]MBU2261708.1 hypothetical protein [Pseudomonadota bacterium]
TFYDSVVGATVEIFKDSCNLFDDDHPGPRENFYGIRSGSLLYHSQLASCVTTGPERVSALPCG